MMSGVSKDVTISQVQLTDMACAALLALMERSIFSLWALPGGAAAVLKPAQKWMLFYLRKARSPKLCHLMSPLHWKPSRKPKPSLSHWQPFIETHTLNGSRVQNDPKHVSHV